MEIISNKVQHGFLVGRKWYSSAVTAQLEHNMGLHQIYYLVVLISIVAPERTDM